MHNGPRIPGDKRMGSYPGKHDTLSKNDVLHQLFGALVDEIKRAFLTLDKATFTALLHDYRKIYGDKAADYAENTYPAWKSGSVRLSGQTMERLLAQVPPYLSEEVKLTVMVKLVRQCNLAVSTKKFVINSQAPAKGVELLRAALRHTKSESAIHDLPPRIHEAALWLNAKDAGLANSMLTRVDVEVHGEQRRHAQAELIKLIDSILHKTARNPSYSINLPGLIINVILERERPIANVATPRNIEPKIYTLKEILPPIGFFLAGTVLPTLFSEIFFGTIGRTAPLLGMLFVIALCIAVAATPYVSSRYQRIQQLALPKTLLTSSLFVLAISWTTMLSNVILILPLAVEERVLPVSDVSNCTKRCQGYPYHAKLVVGGVMGSTGVRLGTEANDKFLRVKGQFGTYIVNIKSISRVAHKR